MAKVLVTSGPTRQYLDPVRFLSNASSGRMGCALAEALCRRGDQVVVVTGPVHVQYPPQAEVIRVMTTEEMLQACLEVFPGCDGVIGAAAPCDYRPERVAAEKLQKTGQPLLLRLVETPDIMATLGRHKRPGQWLVGFALETTDARFRALTKMIQKACDLMVLNTIHAIDSPSNQVQILAPDGTVVARLEGSKTQVAAGIVDLIAQRLMKSSQT